MRPWAGFRVARVIWVVGVALIVLLSPILFSDLVLMIPLTMAFLFAAGPVLSLAQQLPTCRSCGLARPQPGWHETPCRPVRPLTGPTSMRVQPTPVEPTDERVEESGLRALPRADEPR